MERDAFNDEELIEQIQQGGAALQPAARSLFFDLYEVIDERLTSRLIVSGLDYQEGTEYYNSIFEFVFQRVFSDRAIQKAVAGFDPSKGSLRNWILNRVTWAAREWIKRNVATVKRSHTISMNRAPAHFDSPVEVDSTVEMESTGNEDSMRVLDASLAKMTPPQRASVLLRLACVRPLSESDVQLIADVSERGVKEVAAEVELLIDSDADHNAWSRNTNSDNALEICFSDLRYHRKQRAYYQRKLSELSPHLPFEEIDRTARKMTLEELDDDELQDLDCGEMDRQQLRWLRQFAKSCRAVSNGERRIERLRARNQTSKQVVLLEYDEIARILRRTTGQINGYLHRAKECIDHLRT